MNRRLPTLALLAMLMLLGLAAWMAGEQRLMGWLDSLLAVIAGLGGWGPVLWVLLFALLATLFFPVAILSLSSGALFGAGWGTLYTLLGATAAATLSMWLGRWLLGEYVETHIGPRAEQLRQRVDAEGWRFVAFTRLVPLLPFALLNYSFGLTHIRTLPYMLTTFAFMLPARWAYAYAGEVGWSVFSQQFASLRPWLLALGLMLAVVYLYRLLKPLVVARQRPENR